MPGKYLLGIDIGTNNSKGVITDFDGRVLAHRTVEHETCSPQPGWYEHDADKVWWGDFVQIVRAMLQEASIKGQDIVAVGQSTLMPDMLPVDDQGHPLRPGILYGIDTRAVAEIAYINEVFGPEFILEKAGNPVTAQSVGAKILWFKNHEPDLYARTRQFHNCSSYLILKLTGEYILDNGNAFFWTPLYDIHALQWDVQICHTLGIDPALLPRTAYCTEIAGHVTDRAAAETGLAAGTPIIVGCSDALAEVISAGVVYPGEAGLSYGSTMSMLVSETGLRSVPNLGVLPSVVPNIYITGSGTAAAAALTRWFRDNFGQVEMEAQRLLGLNAYHMLSDEAERIPPGSEGLVVLPYFAGERTPLWDAEARGMILGLTLSHSRAHIYRALLEATAYSQRHNLDVMAANGVEVKKIVSVGGGTRSHVWTQIVSDVTGIPQELALSPYGSPYGDAYLAGYAAGIFSDFETLRNRWVKIVRRVEPNPALKPLYDRYYQIYRRLYEPTKDAMHELARLSCLRHSE